MILRRRSAPKNAVRIAARIVAMLMVLFVVSSCSSTTELDADVAAKFDVANNLIAVLSTSGTEEIPQDDILQSISRARSVGTVLRVVVADPNGDFVPAKAVVDRYGGTAISYQADRAGFEGASRDISGGQLDRAVDAAKVELNIGDSAAAFVDVIENEGLDPRGRSLGRTLLFLLLVASALFMIWNAWVFIRERQRRTKRRHDLAQRKSVLRDWAAQLEPEVEALKPLAAEGSTAAKQTLSETQDFISTILPKLDEATSAGELDAAEMRIGRVAIKLRDLRRSLDD